ncbi:PURINE-RICH BINDING PROTEIN-ALPHA ISOFORM B [Salix viminalis]|uniref:PURINE-RICH BINDING PROTEIN-ALPHA ISOFORM B n=1 Tax=Salix viminalis TaxID=40686 RepID=A0A9Q0TMC4_SALVM|nr:PURINE-RICH BINDING PROTEIN-ALPHA ISOFORM B [Salix viminalis]
MEGNSGGGSGSGAAAAGGGGGNDVELMCKTLQVEHKLFYFDLKENPRGRYLKISEKTSATRSTIIVPFSGISWFLDHFNHCVSNSAEDQDLITKELQLDTKAFFLIPAPSLLPPSLALPFIPNSNQLILISITVRFSTLTLVKTEGGAS